MNAAIINSIEDNDGLRCADIARGDDGRFYFREFRRDPEDGGRWTLTADYSATRYPAEADAIAAASIRLPWLAASLLLRVATGRTS